MASRAEVAVPLFVVPAWDISFLLSVSVLICSSKLLMVFSMSSFVLFTLSGSSLIIKSAWFPMYSVSMSSWCFVFVFMILSPLFPMTTAAALLSFTSILSIAGSSCVSCLFCFVLPFLCCRG